MKKKFLALLLVFTNLGQIVPAYANNNLEISNNVTILNLVGDNPSDIFNSKNILLLKDYMSIEDIKKLEEETYKINELEALNGGKNVKTEIIVKAPLNRFSSNGIKEVNVKNHYVYEEEILNKPNDNITKLLDIAWNFYVGTKTSYVWQAISVLGISPSTINDLVPYKTEEKLTSNKTKVISRNCYSKYNNIQNRDVWYLETREETIQNYVDLYAYNKRTNRYERYSGEDEETFYSENYFNKNYIIDYVNNANKNNLLYVKFDKIP